MRNTVKILISASTAVAVTLFTGILNSTPYMLTGATWYGYPIAWVRRLVIAPQYNPWRFDPSGFVIDIAFWFVIAAIILFVTKRKNRKFVDERSLR